MRRTWLTSTTALALVLNAAAPVPGAALGTPAAKASDDPAPLVRLAQADTASDAVEDAQEDAEQAVEDAQEAVTEDAGEDIGDAAAEAEAEVDAAEQAVEEPAAEADAQQQAEDAATPEDDAAPAAVEDAEAADTAEGAAETAAPTKQPVEQQPAEQDGGDGADQEAGEPAPDAEPMDDASADPQAEEDAAAEQEAPEPVEDPVADPAAEPAGESADETADETTDETLGATAAEPEADTEGSAETGMTDGDAPEEDAAAPETGDDAMDQAEQAEPAETTDVPADKAAQSGAEEPAEPQAEEGAAAEADTGDLPEVTAEEQAAALEDETDAAAAAAAAGGEGEVVDTQEGTVTEQEARASDEEFETTASGERNAAAPAAAAPAADDDDDNEVLKNLGVAAAAGLGAYAVGKLLGDGGEVVANTGDRAVVRDPNGQYRIIKDDDTLLRRPGSNVATSTYSDGSTRTEVVAPDNSSTVTVRAADGRVLRRTRILPDGQEVVLFDDTREFDRVDVSNLRPAAADDYDYSRGDVESLQAALSARNETLPDRSFSLNQIRRIDAVRHLVPVIALDAINFRTGSAVIEAAEAQDLEDLGRAMRAAIQDDPRQVFLIEGHTDTVGAASYNLALSDRRAESVALALTEYFDVPPANMIVQGYGEADLRVEQAGDVRANRRGAVRNITPLLTGRN